MSPIDRRRFLALFGAGAAGIVVGNCGGGGGDDGSRGTGDEVSSTSSTTRAATSYVPPAGEWATVGPAAVGWDVAALQAALDFAGERSSRVMVVAVGGKVIAQQAWGVDLSFARDIASCQKSVVSLLVGNLQGSGEVRITEPVTTYLGAGWSRATPEEESRITVRHLLAMTSGLSDQLAFEAEPGTVWRYNTRAYQQLVPLVEEVAGTSVNEVTRTELFDPIGVSATSLWRERPGKSEVAVDPTGRRIQGLVMTAPDMARVGLLVLRDGAWGDRTVLTDPRYLEAALSPSQELNPSYGYLWWLNGQDAKVLPGRARRAPGPLVPSAPEDLVAALGKDDQKIYVCPSLDLVVTRIGANAGPRGLDGLSDFDTELWRRLMEAAPT